MSQFKRDVTFVLKEVPGNDHFEQYNNEPFIYPEDIKYQAENMGIQNYC